MIVDICKRHSRTAIFFVNEAQKTSIENTPNHLKKRIIDKNVSMETLSEEFKPVAFENYEF